MTATKNPRRRCATYTRKSSEEGLEQDFNSLDAQREACEAYIRSQVGEGWQPVRTRYDDGGYSGGSLDRPALSQLLADIEAGKIDTVVVYKVDRLTRSLADFAKIVEILDEHEVSFVSVTQQFNTTTSMGRLTLNMLLSFAQFEREVTGERIRDKIAASKRKGLWMGGYVPLGYAPNGRTLSIVEAEAKTVRTLFRLYLELGSVPRVKEEADRLGLMSKVRRAEGRPKSGGVPFSRGHLYKMLNNPLYAGRIHHKGESFEGQHLAIVDLETWEAVQKQLADQTPHRPAQGYSTASSPLRGKLYDEGEAPLTPSHTVKSGRRYRYYVSRNSSKKSPANDRHLKTSRWRLPAREIEQFVAKGVVALFANPGEVARLAREAEVHEKEISGLLDRVRGSVGDSLDLVRRIDLGDEAVTLQIDLSSFIYGKEIVVQHRIPARIRRRGVEMRLVVSDGATGLIDPRVDQTLVKAIVRAKKWFNDLASGRVHSLEEIGRAEALSDRYVGALIPLAFLAPEIIGKIVSGTQPVELTTQLLMRQAKLPLDWADQESMVWARAVPR